MINTLKINAGQVELCKDIVKYFTAKKDVTDEQKARYAKGLFRRIELREAHEKLRNHTACPYFITKNVAAKASQKEGNGLYNVQRLIDHAAKHPPAAEGEDKPKKTAKKAAKPETAEKKEKAPKKETAKKKTSKKKEAPAEQPAAESTEQPAATDQPATTTESAQ